MVIYPALILLYHLLSCLFVKAPLQTLKWLDLDNTVSPGIILPVSQSQVNYRARDIKIFYFKASL